MDQQVASLVIHIIGNYKTLWRHKRGDGEITGKCILQTPGDFMNEKMLYQEKAHPYRSEASL